jgi:hypothetical protein
MVAIAFQARIKDGMIEVPAEYRDQLTDSVQVIILTHERTTHSGIIARLLEQPIHDPTFVPLKRDDIYRDRA